jgi:hypothetical protein
MNKIEGDSIFLPDDFRTEIWELSNLRSDRPFWCLGLFEKIGIGASVRRMSGELRTNCEIGSSAGSEFAGEVVKQQSAGSRQDGSPSSSENWAYNVQNAHNFMFGWKSTIANLPWIPTRIADLAVDCERKWPWSREIVAIMNVVFSIFWDNMKFQVFFPKPRARDTYASVMAKPAHIQKWWEHPEFLAPFTDRPCGQGQLIPFGLLSYFSPRSRKIQCKRW